ncbi:MAG: GH3 auxin-responsive promoter family protein [Bacteroidales bacterium]|nr:GH3 auxin-responsive promoter family protein [Bacteroidales bacterium]
MNLTRLVYKLVFERRYRQIQRYGTHSTELQEMQLSWLLNRGARTKYFLENHYDATIEGFAKSVPVLTYDQIKPYIQRMLQGEEDVLWPGLCQWFAKSSGTTSDKSKYIPVTDDALKLTHMRGGTDAMVIYLALNPESHVMSGKGLILGGSFANEVHPKGIKAGDLSATLIQNVTPFVNFIRTPRKEIALMSEWEAKLKALTQSTQDVNVTSLSGVPSWMMGVLKEVLKSKGAKDVTEVWPNLEVFFHGGIAFTPYRQQYEQLIPSQKMHYLETYNASEGFFGLQSSWDDHAMQLIIDNRTYYEFIPMDKYDESNPNLGDFAVPLKDVEVGVNYAMVISTPGLWRYIIGDTVRFTQRNPYKFVITGRTKAFINAFGEELMVSNADEALALTCQALGCEIADYTAAPTFAKLPSNEKGEKPTSSLDEPQESKGHHTWVIEFAKAPADLDAFADLLDQNLQQVNSDYEAKRYKGIFLSRLELHSAPTGTFNEWLRQKKGKLGGQIKIPRLSNSRQFVEELREMMEEGVNGSK